MTTQAAVTCNQIDSQASTSQIVHSSHCHIASTSEGFQISRDEEICFFVFCGKESKGQWRVPTRARWRRKGLPRLTARRTRRGVLASIF